MTRVRFESGSGKGSPPYTAFAVACVCRARMYRNPPKGSNTSLNPSMFPTQAAVVTFELDSIIHVW